MTQHVFIMGDRVAYMVPGGQFVSGIMAETWTSPITGIRRARVADTRAECLDPEAGRQVDYDLLRAPEGELTP